MNFIEVYVFLRFPSASAKSIRRPPTRTGVGNGRQPKTHTEMPTVGRCFLPHFCGQNVGFNRIPRQLIRVGYGEPPPPALLVQEGIRGLGALGARCRPFTLAEASVHETPVLVPGRQPTVTQGLTKTLPTAGELPQAHMRGANRRVTGGKRGFSIPVVSQIQALLNKGKYPDPTI